MRQIEILNHSFSLEVEASPLSHISFIFFSFLRNSLPSMKRFQVLAPKTPISYFSQASYLICELVRGKTIRGDLSGFWSFLLSFSSSLLSNTQRYEMRSFHLISWIMDAWSIFEFCRYLESWKHLSWVKTLFDFYLICGVWFLWS